MEMRENIVSSGVTDEIAKMNEGWMEEALIEEESREPTALREWEELFDENLLVKPNDGSAKEGESSIRQLVKALTIKPFSRFILWYLLSVHERDLPPIDYLEHNWKIKTIEEIEHEILEGTVNGMLDRLTSLVFNDISGNGYSYQTNRGLRLYSKLTQEETEGWTKENLREVLSRNKMDISATDAFWILALGLNMDYKDVLLFLKKVFARNGFNLWSSKELILALSFLQKSGDKWAFYIECTKLYEKLSPEVEKPDIHLELNTKTLVSQLEIVNQEMQQDVMNNGVYNESLCQLLRRHKGLIKATGYYVRTANRRACELYEEIVNSDGIKNEISDYYESQAEEYAIGSICVYYDHREGIQIPKDTIFIEETRVGKEKRKVRYRTLEDIYMKPQKKRNIEIAVTCTEETKKHDKQEDDKGYLEKNNIFSCDIKELSNIYNKSKFKVPTKVKPNEITTVSGKLYCEAIVGTCIPAGTVFRAQGNQYLSQEEVNCETSVDVPVKCCDLRHEGLSNRITKPENPILGFVKIKHKKIGFATKSRSFLGYLYPKENIGVYVSENSELLKREVITRLNMVIEDAKITDTLISNLKSHKGQIISRKKLLTLIFLAEMSKREFVEMRDNREWLEEEFDDSMRERVDRFVTVADIILEECGYQGIYYADPYDLLLMYLARSEEPITSYRNLWNICTSNKD